MISRVLSVWHWFGSNRPGFFSGTLLLVILMLSVYAGAIQASLSLGPEGNFPRFSDLFLYAVSHDDLPSLLVDVAFLLLVGPCEERRWGTVAFLALSALTTAALPCAYALVLFVFGGQASRVCGYSGVQLALFTAQCRQVSRRRLLRCVPVWVLPWVFLLSALVLLPATPTLLLFFSICIGHNYHQSFIGTLQELEQTSFFNYIPEWSYVSTSARLRLPTHTTSHRCNPHSHTSDREELAPSVNPPPSSWSGAPLGSSALSADGADAVWGMNQSHGLTETELLEEQMLRAGILASLWDAPDGSAEKVELSKSSVSSLRLQQLERMGFPTEKAVVALAASKQLEGAVSLLIDDCIGEETVAVVSPQNR